MNTDESYADMLEMLSGVMSSKKYGISFHLCFPSPTLALKSYLVLRVSSLS